ncbi:MAG: hypothetical protein KGZ83_02290 [Sulfuricella sp.]|nr:hypothetical protein [Sulfuricella sp.]
MNRPPLSDVAIARAFIGWRERRRCGFVSLPAEEQVKPGAREFSSFKISGGLLKEFDNLILEKAYPHLTDDERENAIVAFFQKYRDFPGWHRAMLEGLPLNFEFFGGQPQVELNMLPLLRKTESDGDALAMLAFVQQADWWQAAELETWGGQIGCADRGLNSLLKKGTVENHVHMEGGYTVPHNWMLILFGELSLNAIDKYSISAQEKSEGTSLSEIQEDVWDIQKGLNAWTHLLTKFARAQYDEPAIPTSHPIRTLPLPDFDPPPLERRVLPVTQPQRDALTLERCVLAWAWHQALSNPCDDASEEEKQHVINQLDKYLFAKNLFLKAVIQYPGSPPGLTRFKKHFKRHKASARYSPSRSVMMYSFATLLENIADNPHLEKLEFRIAPCDDVRGYINFFQAWNGLAGKFQEEANEDNERLAKLYRNTRFIIHFIRDPKGIGDTPSFHRLRRQLGVQSAILHHFRVRHPDLAKLIVAIDVANLERECPPEIFAPFLRLLREPHLARPNTASDWDEIGFKETDPDYTDKWRRVELAGSLLTPSLPKLGLTYHAGEDFFNPLDGMRQMDGAIRYCKMAAGDRIGHGLAAGMDLDKFFSSAASQTSMPQGAILDTLVWLYQRTAGQIPPAESRALDDAKNELSHKIYGCRIEWRTLEELAELRFKLPPNVERYREHPKKLSQSSQADEVLLQEHFDPDIADRRKVWINQYRYFSNLPTICRIAQESFMQEINAKRIIVEFNPSSNQSLLRIDTLAQHPYWGYRSLLGKAPEVTINTDDPGVFNTRQDIEYGLMFHSMLKRLPIEAALDELEQIRVRGFTSHFG